MTSHVTLYRGTHIQYKMLVIEHEDAEMRLRDGDTLECIERILIHPGDIRRIVCKYGRLHMRWYDHDVKKIVIDMMDGSSIELNFVDHASCDAYLDRLDAHTSLLSDLDVQVPDSDSDS